MKLVRPQAQAAQQTALRATNDWTAVSTRAPAMQPMEKRLLWKQQMHSVSMTDTSHLQCVGCYRLTGPATLYKVDKQQLAAHLLPGAQVEILNRDVAVVFTYEDLLDMAENRCGSSFWLDVDHDDDVGSSNIGSGSSSSSGAACSSDRGEEANCLLVGSLLRLEGEFTASQGATPLVHNDMTVLRVHSWSAADSVALSHNGRVSHPVNVCPHEDVV